MKKEISLLLNSFYT